MNKLPRRNTVARLVLLAFTMFGFVSSVQAGLIFESFVANHGTGYGNTLTILSLQGSNNPNQNPTGTEQGEVKVAIGGGDVGTGDISGGSVPSVQNQTRSLSELMVTTPEEFRLLFDANEPGNTAENPITINELIVNFYTTTGALILSQSLTPVPLIFNTTTGTGTDDAIFRLDTAGIAAAQAAFAMFTPVGDIRVGASARLTNASSGADSFAGSTVMTSSVPEPATLALLGIGLIGISASARRRKQS